MKFEEKLGADNDRAPKKSGLATAAVGLSQAPTAAVDNPVKIKSTLPNLTLTVTSQRC